MYVCSSEWVVAQINKILAFEFEKSLSLNAVE